MSTKVEAVLRLIHASLPKGIAARLLPISNNLATKAARAAYWRTMATNTYFGTKLSLSLYPLLGALLYLQLATASSIQTNDLDPCSLCSCQRGGCVGMGKAQWAIWDISHIPDS